MARVIDTMAEHPLRFRVVRNTLRRALVKRFPYAIYYRVAAEVLVVVGLMHGSRDPHRWMELEP